MISNKFIKILKIHQENSIEESSNLPFRILMVPASLYCNQLSVHSLGSNLNHMDWFFTPVCRMTFGDAVYKNSLTFRHATNFSTNLQSHSRIHCKCPLSQDIGDFKLFSLHESAWRYVFIDQWKEVNVFSIIKQISKCKKYNLTPKCAFLNSIHFQNSLPYAGISLEEGWDVTCLENCN